MKIRRINEWPYGSSYYNEMLPIPSHYSKLWRGEIYELASPICVWWGFEGQFGKEILYIAINYRCIEIGADARNLKISEIRCEVRAILPETRFTDWMARREFFEIEKFGVSPSDEIEMDFLRVCQKAFDALGFEIK